MDNQDATLQSNETIDAREVGDEVRDNNGQALSHSREHAVHTVDQDSYNEETAASSGLLSNTDQNEKAIKSTSETLNLGKKNTTTRAIQRFWRGHWVFEITSYVVASAAFISLVIMLRLYQGKQLPEWPFGITINAMVSVLVVIIKAGLIVVLSEGLSQSKWQFFRIKDRVLMNMEAFDSASRGPWGSFQFLFKVVQDEREVGEEKGVWRRFITWIMPRRDNFTVYFAKSAALLIILASVLDPFTQQVLQFEYCSQIDPNFDVNIARTNYYKLDDTNDANGAIDLDMAIAINTGLNNPPRTSYGKNTFLNRTNAAASLVKTRCETGNCTFDHFSTLAMCHTCDDVSSDITMVPNTPPRTIIFMMEQDPYATSDIATNISVGILLNLTEGGANGPSNRYFEALAYKRGDLMETVVNVFSLLTLNLGEWFPYNETASIAPSATLCTISPCVRSYNSSMVNGTLREWELKRVMMPYLVGDNILKESYQLATSQVPDGTGWKDCIPQNKSGDGLVQVAVENVDITIPASLPDASNFPPVFYPEECVWTYSTKSPSAIGAEAIRQMQNLRVESFQTAIYAGGFVRFEGVPEGTLTSMNLWRLGDADLNTTDRFMSDFADTISARIRTEGEYYAFGISHVNATCIRVNWVWISFLAAMMSLTLLFLVVLLAMHAHKSTTKQVWKSSSLAVLFCSMDDGIKRQLTGARQSMDDIFRVAGAARVRLVEDESEGSAKFVSADDRGMG